MVLVQQYYMLKPRFKDNKIPLFQNKKINQFTILS